MSAAAGARLAVVLPTDRLETIRATVAALGRQTAARSIELVVVAPPGVEIGNPDPDGRFAATAVARCPGLDDPAWLPRARAAGARAASAPVVAFGETHSFPEPGWAAALLAAHAAPCAAVGACMLNANPRTAISWANLYVDFGPWVERRERGAMDELPGHNTSYKRDVLLARGARLEGDLASETLLARELRAAGGELHFEPDAATRHLNLATVYWFLERFDHDRDWAALRAARWGPARRLLYVLGAPLIPLVRYARILPDLRRTRRAAEPRLALTLLAGLVAGAAGEAAGYLRRDAGASRRRLHDVELYRTRWAGPEARET